MPRITAHHLPPPAACGLHTYDDYAMDRNKVKDKEESHKLGVFKSDMYLKLTTRDRELALQARALKAQHDALNLILRPTQWKERIPSSRKRPLTSTCELRHNSIPE